MEAINSDDIKGIGISLDDIEGVFLVCHTALRNRPFLLHICSFLSTFV
jgi:hypothetical protein